MRNVTGFGDGENKGPPTAGGPFGVQISPAICLSGRCVHGPVGPFEKRTVRCTGGNWP
jgi:hypothetical protein